MKSIIRTLGFVNKELREVARQPTLIVTLILGPFLILLLFGIGHNPVQPPLRAMLVIPPGLELPVPQERYQELFGSAIKLVSVSHDGEDARRQVVDREVDVAVIIPTDLYEKLSLGEQAKVAVVFDETDPVMSNYIRFVASAQISDMNRAVLEGAISQALAPQGALDQFTASSEQELAGLDSDIAAGDLPSAQRRIARLDGMAESVQSRLTAVAGITGSQAGGQSGGFADRIRLAVNTVGKFRSDLSTLSRDLDSGAANVPQDLAQLHADSVAMRQVAAGLGELPAQVISAPLTSEAENLAPLQPGFVAFYAPAVLALLLQHVAVTFGALSMVRERLYGATELFRVAPVTPAQILLGKGLAYVLLGGVITAALTYLLLYVLRVPFTGSYQLYAEVVAGLLLASLAVGFFVSLLSGSERQAVQLSMLVLMASVFFSGFFMRLESFVWPVRGVAYILPVTYGIQALQDVMLRGATSANQALLALGAIAVILFVVAALLLRGELRRATNKESLTE